MGVARDESLGRPVSRIGLLAIVLMSAAAHAEVDWAKGLVIAPGIGIANRHAPTPAAAREPARRMAEDAARKQLAQELPALPLAEGGTLADKLGDKQVAARIAAAVDHAITVEATPQTDGSWNVKLAVPLEAVRQAIAGPRASKASDADPPIVIVEGLAAKPSLGVAIGGVTGAALWVKAIPAWAKGAPRVKAGAASAPVGGPSTLFVIVVK
jgi:hypothetical protein